MCVGVVMEDYLLEEWLEVLRMTLSRLMPKKCLCGCCSARTRALSGVGLDIKVIEDIDVAP